MKVVRTTAAWIFGFAGFFAAGTQLLHAAQLREDQATVQVPEVDPSAVTGITVATMTEQEQIQHQDQIARFRAQYGDETLSRLVFGTDQGQLRITGFKVDAKDFAMGGSQGPSCT